MGEYYGMLTLREAYDLYCGAVVDAYAKDELCGFPFTSTAFRDLFDLLIFKPPDMRKILVYMLFCAFSIA